MGFRDENEALRAKVDRLEEEVARLRGERGRDTDHSRVVKRQSLILIGVASLASLAPLPCILGGLVTRPSAADPRDADALATSNGATLTFEARVAPGGPIYEAPFARDEYSQAPIAVPLADQPRVILICGYSCPPGVRSAAFRGGTVEVYARRSSSSAPEIPDHVIAEHARAHGLMTSQIVLLSVSEDPLPFTIGSSFVAFSMVLLGWLMWIAHRTLSRREVPLPSLHDHATRSAALTVVATFLSCGLYGLYWQWATTAQVRRLTGRPDLVPLVDLGMTLLTFGLWRFWVAYRNAEAIDQEMARHGETLDLRTAAVLLSLGTLVCGICEWVLLYRLQEGINRLAIEAEVLPSTSVAVDTTAG